MQFMFEEKLLDKIGGLEKVSMCVLDTESLNPRTNRRKLRAFFVRHCGVAPCMVKKAFHDMDLATVPRRTLKETRAWIRRYAPEIADDEVNLYARLVHKHPASPLGELRGGVRRVLQAQMEVEKALRIQESMDRAIARKYGDADGQSNTAD